MAALLRLPAELRLQIYEPLISRQPYRMYLDEFFAIDCQLEWIQLNQLKKFDADLAAELVRMYWRSNTFMIPEVSVVPKPGDETHVWLDEHVRDNIKDLRFLEFGSSEWCAEVHTDGHSSVCYNIVYVDLLRREAQLAASGRRGDGCKHLSPVVEKLGKVLALSARDGNDGMTKALFWALHECFARYPG